MRGFSVVALLAVALAQDCDITTCYKCQNVTGCAWYTAGPFSDCRKIADVPSTLNVTKTPDGQCPACQAGSCVDCRDSPSGNCAWFKSDIPAVSGKCAVNTSTPTAYTKMDYPCPVCNTYDSDCTGCFGQQNASGCNYYTLPGQSSGKCRESSPGFAYSKVALGYCNGNPCPASQTCRACQAVNVSDGSKPCAWFESKVGALYGPKCDSKDAGVVDDTLYTLTAEGSCPICAGSTCVACSGESGCRWVAVDLGVGTSFGQCIKPTDSIPGGKTLITTCPATCDVHSCSSCISNSACRWYSDSPIADDKCDLASDSWQYGTHRATYKQGQTCPSCVSNRCYECASETAGCGWYVRKAFGAIVPGTGDCQLLTADHGSKDKIEKDSEDCEGSPQNGASAMGPSLAALAVAFIVYYN